MFGNVLSRPGSPIVHRIQNPTRLRVLKGIVYVLFRGLNPALCAKVHHEMPRVPSFAVTTGHNPEPFFGS